VDAVSLSFLIGGGVLAVVAIVLAVVYRDGNSFKLAGTDGRQATGAGCLLGGVVGVIVLPLTVLGLVVNPIFGSWVGDMAKSAGEKLFRVGSRWLGRRGVEVWKGPTEQETADALVSGENQRPRVGARPASPKTQRMPPDTK
jgi:hypothetical protein